jgi:putative redox protein
MKAKIKWIEGLALIGVSDSNHWITMDAPEKLGGFGAGGRPMELFLLGLAGCTAMDVLSILKKKRVNLSDFSMEIEVKRAEDHPRVFSSVKLHYIFTGKDVRPIDVERSIELSQGKYCSASAMLKKSVEILHDYQIIDSDE